MSRQFFYAEESTYIPGKWKVEPDHDLLKLTHTAGSFNVLASRIFGLTYAQYLRMCRDVYGAELVGKNCIYILPYFNGYTDGLKNLIKELNSRVETILKEKICS